MGNAWRSKQSRARLQVTDLDKNVCVLILLEDFKLEYPKSENEVKYLKKNTEEKSTDEPAVKSSIKLIDLLLANCNSIDCSNNEVTKYKKKEFFCLFLFPEGI